MRKLFIDCGAWTGNSIASFRERYSDSNEYDIVCFECHPNSVKKLKYNYPKIQIYEKAVWINNDLIKMKIGSGKWVESSTIIQEKKVKRHDPKQDVMVQCVDFSSWINKIIKDGDYVVCKMNIEGAEYTVLNKMILDGSINKINELWVEWHWHKMEGWNEERHLQLVKRIPENIKIKNWSLDHKRNVVYTVTTDTGKYIPNEPLRMTEGWDYICFTTDKDLKSKLWDIKYVEPQDITPEKLSRKIKILNSDYLPGYDTSIYIDCRFTIRCNLYKFVDDIIGNDFDLAVMKHNRRSCLFQEAEFLKLQNTEQVKKYQEIVPKNFGLWAPGIMIRRHNVPALQAMMKTWYSEMIKGSHRDQISFAYARFKHQNVNMIEMPFTKTYEDFMSRPGEKHRIP